MSRSHSEDKSPVIFLAIIALALVLAALFVRAHYVTTVSKARKLLLQQDFYLMCSALDLYGRDYHQHPQSLDDLVKAGYLPNVPTDRISGRNDTWVTERSDDPAAPEL